MGTEQQPREWVGQRVAAGTLSSERYETRSTQERAEEEIIEEFIDL